MELSETLEQLETQVNEGKKRGLIGALQIGRALSKIQAGNLFLIDGCKDFPGYCEKVHGFKRSTGYNMIAIYQTWGQAILANPEFQNVDPSRLVRLLPLIEKEDKDELLRDAVFIPDSQSFNNQIRNKRGFVATDECDHPDGFQPIPWTQCPRCKQRRKVTL